nr:MAG TPA: hypothetical protein [Caudoviricetes sp.]
MLDPFIFDLIAFILVLQHLLFFYTVSTDRSVFFYYFFFFKIKKIILLYLIIRSLDKPCTTVLHI